MKSEKIYKLVFIIIGIFITMFAIPTLVTKLIIESKKENQCFDKYLSNIKDKGVYMFPKMLSVIDNVNESKKYEINVNNKKDVVYGDIVNVLIDINNSIDISNMSVSINDQEYKLSKNKEEFNINVKEEKNELDIKILNYNQIIKESKLTIYYVKTYQKQYLDEISKNGIQVHYRIGNYEDFNKDKDLLYNLGVKNVRAEFYIDQLIRGNFNKYDNWINDIKNNKLNIIAMVDSYPEVDNNKKIDNQEEIKEYIKGIENFNNKYKWIKNIEVYNELNQQSHYKEALLDENDIKWYALLGKKLKQNKNLNNINLISNGTSTPYNNEKGKITSESFYKDLYKNGGMNFFDEIAYHPYSTSINDFKNKNISHKILVNNNGGFTKINITEYGNTVYNSSEDKQAIEDVKKTVELENFAEYKILYNLWTTADNNSYEQFGLLTHDYLPRKSYFAMKNYYQNTNGSEYIDPVNLADGLEAHVYDKDGKPKMIVWAIDESKPVTIDYKDFSATDLYGKAIENTNGKLEITTSPVYLDNISENYFYQAISNSITDGYSGFKNKFKDEISKVNGLNEKIDDLNNRAKGIYNLSIMDENTANELIKEHFELGNYLINAYNNNTLKVEYVKLSSMLDSLNTIGNSYEDLITVSAKTRMTDLSKITNEVNKAKSLAEDNEQFEIVYPNKIYKFAQDLLDTSSYVLGLDEENDIKTGLINSKALHAKYLAEWSQEFSKIYIKDALKISTNSIIEKNEIIKNNNKAIYENQNVKNSYEKLQDSINELLKNPENNNLDEIYSNQMDIAKTIVNENNNKKLDTQIDNCKQIINSIFDITDDYKSLYKYYIRSDKIDKTQVENNLNNILNRYNENSDISALSSEVDMINQIKNLYNNSIETENVSDNYLNKQRIVKTCDIVSQMLENDIKHQADVEYGKISNSSDQDFGKVTNKDETITINLPNDKAKVTNNNGTNKVVFTENGSKVFKIDIRGYEYDYKIEVNNIDKLPPVLNVEEEGNSINPNVTDNNLDKITITKEEKEIQYNTGKAISEPGIYTITAVDKAGNQTSAKSIVYGTFVNEQNEEEKYVPVSTGLKTQEIIENSEYLIIKDEQSKSENDYVATGDKLKAKNNTYTIIAKGDVTGSGVADIMSLIQIRKNIVGLKDFTKIQQLASDLNDDGMTNIMDLVRERRLIVGDE